VCPFDTIEGAVETVITIMQLGVPVARLELLDELQIDAVNRYSRLAYPVKPTLFLEFHGTSAEAVAEHAQTAQEIAAEHGGTGFQWETTPENRARLWQARHNAFYAAVALRPGAKAWTTDVCVPISRLAECILETRRDLEGSRLVAPLMGHVGDGNFHLVIPLDPNSPDELAEVTALNERLVHRAQAMGGTCTGEHGVGLGKMDHLPAEHGDALDVMRAIKHALDPHNLMNPGKLLPGS
jgi:D-lactate dehydrogenase (cytochrome)